MYSNFYVIFILLLSFLLIFPFSKWSTALKAAFPSFWYIYYFNSVTPNWEKLFHETFYDITLSLLVHYYYLFLFLYILVTLYLTFSSFWFFSAKAEELLLKRREKIPFFLFPTIRIGVLFRTKNKHLLRLVSYWFSFVFFYAQNRKAFLYCCYIGFMFFSAIAHLKAISFHINHLIFMHKIFFKFLVIIINQNFYVGILYPGIHVLYFTFLGAQAIDDFEFTFYAFCVHYFLIFFLLIILLPFYPPNF